MIKVKKLVGSVRSITKESRGKDKYSFTQHEAGLPAAPKSMFISHLVSVVGSVPLMIVGTAMTATSVVEWGVPLIAASIAGVSAPLVVRGNRQKKHCEELAAALNVYLPQVTRASVPQISVMQAKALYLGGSLELPLDNGATLSVSFKNRLEKRLTTVVDNALDEPKKPGIIGSVKITPADNGIRDFDALLNSMIESDPDIAAAMNKALTKSITSGAFRKPLT